MFGVEDCKTYIVDDGEVLQVPVDFIEVQAVANHEDVRNGETDIVGLETTTSSSSLLDERSHTGDPGMNSGG